MKLTITDKVFVPVSNHKESTHWVVDTIEKNGDSYFTKEETNMYVLSKEEIEKVIIKAVELAREGIVVHRIPEWETDKEFDYTDLQIINSIL
jgi:hypothetical protein